MSIRKYYIEVHEGCLCPLCLPFLSIGPLGVVHEIVNESNNGRSGELAHKPYGIGTGCYSASKAIDIIMGILRL